MWRSTSMNIAMTAIMFLYRLYIVCHVPIAWQSLKEAYMFIVNIISKS